MSKQTDSKESSIINNNLTISSGPEGQAGFLEVRDRIYVDSIEENTLDSGVSIENVSIKDGNLVVNSVVDSTSSSSGSIISLGGIGVDKNLHVGNTIVSNNGSDNTGKIHFSLRKDNLTRFNIGLLNNETGSNIGSDFRVWRYDDSGTFIGQVLSIKRDTGDIGITKDLILEGNQKIQGGTLTTGPTFQAINSSPDAGSIDFGDGTGWLFRFRTRSTSNPLITIQDNGLTSFSNTLENSISTLGGVSITKSASLGIIPSPSNPGVNFHKVYFDSSDNLLKSKNSSGNVKVYNLNNQKGDIQSHSGTNDEKIGVSYSKFLFSDSSTSTGLSWSLLSDSKAVLIAILEDVKTLGTNGGSSVAGSWTTRVLNTITLSDPLDTTSITLASNAFTLTPGLYSLEVKAPVYRSSLNLLRLFNTTDNVVSLYGANSDSESGGSAVQIHSFLTGFLSLSSTKTFRLEHIVNSSRTGTGFGIASGLGVSEIYTKVNLIKIK